MLNFNGAFLEIRCNLPINIIRTVKEVLIYKLHIFMNTLIIIQYFTIYFFSVLRKICVSPYGTHILLYYNGTQFYLNFLM